MVAIDTGEFAQHAEGAWWLADGSPIDRRYGYLFTTLAAPAPSDSPGDATALSGLLPASRSTQRSDSPSFTAQCQGTGRGGGSLTPRPNNKRLMAHRHVVKHQRRRTQRGTSGARVAEIPLRHKGLPHLGRRRVSVRYDTVSTPASSSTCSESSFGVSSMIRANTSPRNASSPPVALSKPSES